MSRENKAATLLSPLVGLSQGGLGRWFAGGLSDDPHGPSLAVQEPADQKVLVHRFVGTQLGPAIGGYRHSISGVRS